jgi:hypothetical protein
MAKAELKTKPTGASVEDFFAGFKDEERRKDCRTLAALMKQATGAEPKMWGSAIVGFGDWHYKYASGCEGDWFRMGFSPRKQALTLYLTCGGFEKHAGLLARLGKHKTGKGCLYVKRLADVDMAVLRRLIEAAAKKAS